MENKPIAFFDLDETLINTKSMFSFLRFYLEKKYGAKGERKFQLRMKTFSSISRLGVPRQIINRVYYFMYMFNDIGTFKNLASMWFNDSIRNDNFFIEPVVKELKEHQKNGVEVCLVSGSCRHIINPIAEYLNVTNIICSEQKEIMYYFTGGIKKPMIGKNKKEAVLEFIRNKNGVKPEECYAYGDHISDIEMLEVVGHPTIVDHNKDDLDPLVKLAKNRNWNIIIP
jgi:HAD superfamily hydrolase (TIGR01490 family)